MDSNRNNNLIYNKELILSNPKYQEILSKFERLFKLNNFNATDNFSSKVWFIQKNLSLYQMLLQTPETNTGSKMYEILNTLRVKEDIFGDVEKLLYLIIEHILKSYAIYERSMKTLELYNAYNTKIKIEEILKLNDTNNSSFNTGNLSSEKKSFLKILIKKFENFKAGQYIFNLHVNQLKNYNSSNSSFNSNRYQDVNYNLLKDVNIVEDNLALEVKTSKNNNFKYEAVEFEGLNLSANKSSAIKFSNTSLSHFSVSCLNKSSKILKNSKDTYFLDLSLNLIDNLINSYSNNNSIKNSNLNSNSIISEELTVKLFKDNNDYEDTKMNIDLILEMDDKTKLCILKRILEILDSVIESKIHSMEDVNEILDYFPEIKPSIMNILTSDNPIEKRYGCCNSCYIF